MNWIFCKVSNDNESLALAELMLHDLSFKHYHLSNSKFNLLVDEDGFAILTNIKYYNLIGRYHIINSKKIIEEFSWGIDIGIKRNSDEIQPHRNIHLITKYRKNEILYAGVRERLDKQFLDSLDPNEIDKVTIIYIDHQNSRPLYTKFSTPTRYLKFYYQGQDLSKIAIKLKTQSPRVQKKLVSWLNRNRLPAYIDDSGTVYVYDVEVAFSAYRRFVSTNGIPAIKYEITEGPEYGYVLGVRRHAKVRST